MADTGSATREARVITRESGEPERLVESPGGEVVVADQETPEVHAIDSRTLIASARGRGHESSMS
ncbi:hypothetical protein QLQ12_13250 [Actinoplanes sp. NEAU-A12]|uniref:Uncharacterized protein n=1 Tax=Actinoplanes sandaracinus TaxID=3045177 RepID=A0ABT6WIL2_9ACTN|nr:hypothetical protein [Actinoplanes sandaracinus]MDI6099564.1 hypothetical protein [Actinoplanes sandaracinus]